MEFKGKTLQEHIWNSMDEILDTPYGVWDWVILFEHYGIPINDEDYVGWVKELKEEGKL